MNSSAQKFLSSDIFLITLPFRELADACFSRIPYCYGGVTASATLNTTQPGTTSNASAACFNGPLFLSQLYLSYFIPKHSSKTF